MKSIVLSIALFASFISYSHAQGFSLGIKAGANVNKLTGKSFNDQFTYGYHAGVFAQIKLGNRLQLQPEVVFNQVNTDTSSQFSQLYKVNSSTISNIKLSYLSIPLILNYKLSKGFSIQAGPQYGILLDQHKDLLQNGKSAFKDGDFSLLAGMQIKFASFRIYGRYVVGLNNINDIDNNDKWKNQSIQRGVGFAIF